MSSVLLISIELDDPEETSDDVFDGIASYKNWAFINEHTFLIYTGHQPVDVRNHLWQLMGPTDSILVSILRAPAGWAGLSPEVSEWIRQRLR